MFVFNRSAAIVIAKQPFLDWLHSVDPTSQHLTLDDLNEDQSIYLLPESESDEQSGKNLRKFCQEIFREQLEAWWRDQSDWPSDLSFGEFSRWFDYEFHSMVFDVEERTLEREKA